jgi:16S rRNA (adenine1518-N6/adenine1519-N6)-dimethyltransferase
MVTSPDRAGESLGESEQDFQEGLLGAAAIRDLAQRLGIHPTKKWGQNFVIDPNTVRRIVASAQLEPSDVVIEVGPGLGSLTLALLPHVQRVLAVEIDERLARQLPLTVAEHAPGQAGKLDVIHQDAMTITANNSPFPAEPTALVANLPYNISVPVVLHLLTSFPTIRTVLVMVQKEVADRLVAGPGSRTYGVPSVKARWFGELEYAGNVGRSVFWPAPNVDSGLVRLTRVHRADPGVSQKSVFSVIDAAFSQRRKMLRSALASLLGSTAQAEQVLTSAGIDPSVRGEQLDLDAFIAIARASTVRAA